MASQTYNDVTKFRYLPLESATFRFLDVMADTYAFHNLDAGSSFKLSPILQRDDLGMDIPVAYEFEGIFLPLHTSFPDLNTVLLKLQSLQVVEFDAYFKAAYEQQHGALMHIKFNTAEYTSATNSCLSSAIRANVELEQGDDNIPQLRITVKGLVTAAAWNTCLFKSANFSTVFW